MSLLRIWLLIVLVFAKTPAVHAAAPTMEKPPTLSAEWVQRGNDHVTFSDAPFQLPLRFADYQLDWTTTKPGDGVAHYRNASGNPATIFIFKPQIADAAVIALTSTNRIIARYGPATSIANKKIESGWHYLLLSGGVENNLAVDNILNIARIGEWIISIRITGPTESTKILSLYSSVARDSVFTVGKLEIATELNLKDCVSEPRDDATVRTPTMSEVALGAMITIPTSGEIIPFPRSSPQSYCRNRALEPAGNAYVILRGAPAQRNDGAVKYILYIADAGTFVEISRLGIGTKKSQEIPVFVSIHLTNETRMLRIYDDWPSEAQVRRLLDEIPGLYGNPLSLSQLKNNSMEIQINNKLPTE